MKPKQLLIELTPPLSLPRNSTSKLRLREQRSKP